MGISAEMRKNTQKYTRNAQNAPKHTEIHKEGKNTQKYAKEYGTRGPSQEEEYVPFVNKIGHTKNKS